MSADIIITGIMIGDDFVNIQYAEPREQARSVSVTRSMMIDSEEIQAELEILLDTVQDIVDKGALILRNPPQKIRRRQFEGLEFVEDEDDGTA